MNVIFLDFNGVLDTWDNMDEIDKGNLLRLKRIVDETESKVVISSSLKNSYYWTGHYSLKLTEVINELENIGIDVLGITPNLGSREDEIKLYLKEHSEVDNFCIIDDDYDMKSLRKNLVKLPNQIEKGQMGLDDFHADMAIKILKNKGY